MDHLREVLKDVLGDRALSRYTEHDIQNLVDNDYTDREALQTATRDGLKQAGLTPGKVDELLSKFSGAATMLNCSVQRLVNTAALSGNQSAAAPKSRSCQTNSRKQHQ